MCLATASTGRALLKKHHTPSPSPPPAHPVNHTVAKNETKVKPPVNITVVKPPANETKVKPPANVTKVKPPLNVTANHTVPGNQTKGPTPKRMRALLSDDVGVVYEGPWASVVKNPDGSVQVEAPFTYIDTKGKGGGTEVLAPGTRVNVGDGKRRLLSGTYDSPGQCPGAGGRISCKAG